MEKNTYYVTVEMSDSFEADSEDDAEKQAFEKLQLMWENIRNGNVSQTEFAEQFVINVVNENIDEVDE